MLKGMKLGETKVIANEASDTISAIEKKIIKQGKDANFKDNGLNIFFKNDGTKKATVFKDNEEFGKYKIDTKSLYDMASFIYYTFVRE
jgi:hypothetical protein